MTGIQEDGYLKKMDSRSSCVQGIIGISEKAVHKDIVMMRILQQDAQRAYERTHTREQWMELMGRNYIDNKRSIESKTDTTGRVGSLPEESENRRYS